jgi:hypothetical protein
MAVEGEGRRRYPTWLRVVVVALQALAVVVGLLVGNATYEAWSAPDDPPPPTTVVAPVAPASEAPVTEDPTGDR